MGFYLDSRNMTDHAQYPTVDAIPYRQQYAWHVLKREMHLTKINDNNIDRVASLASRMHGKLLRYDPRPVETFFTDFCSHRPRKCRTTHECTKKSDVQKPGSRAYYKQIWLGHFYCKNCYTQQASPISAYQVHPTGRTNMKEKLLVVPCQLCGVALYAYQAVMPFTGEFEEHRGRRKSCKTKKEIQNG